MGNLARLVIPGLRQHPWGYWSPSRCRSTMTASLPGGCTFPTTGFSISIIRRWPVLGAGTMSGTMYRWSLSWLSPFSFCRRPGPRVLGTGCPTGSSAFHIFPQVGIRVFSRQLLNYQSVRIRNGRLSQPSPMVSYGGHSFDREHHDLGVVCGVRRAQLPTHSTAPAWQLGQSRFLFRSQHLVVAALAS